MSGRHVKGWQVVAVSKTGARRRLSRVFSIQQAALDFKELAEKHPPEGMEDGEVITVESVDVVEK